MNNINWEDLTGKRILYNPPYLTVIKEARIEEISPSKRYIKLDGQWYKTTEIKILEVLED